MENKSYVNNDKTRETKILATIPQAQRSQPQDSITKKQSLRIARVQQQKLE